MNDFYGVSLLIWGALVLAVLLVIYYIYYATTDKRSESYMSQNNKQARYKEFEEFHTQFHEKLEKNKKPLPGYKHQEVLKEGDVGPGDLMYIMNQGMLDSLPDWQQDLPM